MNYRYPNIQTNVYQRYVMFRTQLQNCPLCAWRTTNYSLIRIADIKNGVRHWATCRPETIKIQYETSSLVTKREKQALLIENWQTHLRQTKPIIWLNGKKIAQLLFLASVQETFFQFGTGIASHLRELLLVKIK